MKISFNVERGCQIKKNLFASDIIKLVTLRKIIENPRLKAINMRGLNLLII